MTNKKTEKSKTSTQKEAEIKKTEQSNNTSKDKSPKEKVEKATTEKVAEKITTAQETKEVEVPIMEQPEYEELNNKYLRLYAEFENFRNRSARESLENYQTAGAELIKKLLPTLENFGRAFVDDNKGQDPQKFEKGINMIYKNLQDVLFEAGLEEINPEAEEFDPTYHEALLKQDHETVVEDHVIQVIQKGYKFKSKILKHAQVIISQGKAELS